MTESSDDGKKLSSTMKRSLAPGKESSPEKNRMPDFSADEWSEAVERAEETQRLKEERIRSRKLGKIHSDYEGKKTSD